MALRHALHKINPYCHGAATVAPRLVSLCQARSLHTTAPLGLKRRLFRSFFRFKRKHPTDVPSDPHKVTLFHQDPLHEDLRLPKPAEPLLRIGAGVADALVSVACGAAAGGIQYALGGADMHLVASTTQMAALLMWVVRDSLADGGNRSFGKKWFGLEIAYWDGTLPTRSQALLRNWYFGILPFMNSHPVVDIIGTLMFVFDGSSVMFTQDARKLGDYMIGTRVVMERTGRDVRLQEMAEREEIRMLRDEAQSMAPGVLQDTANDNSDAWYENVQRAIHTSAAAEEARQAQVVQNKAKQLKTVVPPAMPEIPTITAESPLLSNSVTTTVTPQKVENAAPAFLKDKPKTPKKLM